MKNYKRMKLYICIIILLSFHELLPAQTMLGMTGLLSVPSADMQKDKTVIFGTGFLNKELTPSMFSYNTLNYYLNITILPFLEVGYSCTLFKATNEFIPEKKGRFVNQDRALSFRIRPVKEGKYIPAFAVGATDVTDNFLKSNSLNSFYSGIYLAATKHFLLGKEKIGTHLAYTYTKQRGVGLKGISLGLTYTPSCIPELNLVAEATRKNVNIGATCLFFNHLFLQALLQKGQFFSGGLGYKIYL